MLASTALLILLPQLPADTLHLPAREAFDRALDHSVAVALAEARADSSARGALQAAALPNPGFSIQVENLGRAREFTGLSSPAGLEGQAFFTQRLPFGPTRSGAIATSRANARAADAQADAVRWVEAEATLAAFSDLLRAARRVELAEVEAETLRALRDRLRLQADAGRAAEGDAARAELEYGLTVTELARRRGAAAAAEADVARRLGEDPSRPIALDLERCSAEDRPWGSEAEAVPELRAARARVAAAEGRVEASRGRALPDVEPQVGILRGGGLSALFLGANITLPLFDRGREGTAAALAARQAAEWSLAGLEAAREAELAAAVRAVAALDEAGSAFSASWIEALERSVTASEARFNLGEGTLAELLDHRRARIRALDDHARWLAERRAAHARLQRLRGFIPDVGLLCDTDPYPQLR